MKSTFKFLDFVSAPLRLRSQLHRRLMALVCILMSTQVLLGSMLAYAVDNSQLWLPRNYYRHFKHLQEAARVSEETQMCQHVIAGTILQNRSTLEHPIFKITCRDNERKTFAYIVDGLSYEILNRPPPPDPEALELIALNRKLDELWSLCSDQLQQRTQGLRGVAWLIEGGIKQRPQAVMNGDEDVLFEVLFNSAGRRGNVLNYQALCHFRDGDKDINIYAYLDAGVEMDADIGDGTAAVENEETDVDADNE